MQIFQSFIPEVVEIIRRGGIGVIPTDTVYGLVGSLFSEPAIERMYILKNREITKPVGTILIDNVEQIEQFTDSESLLKAQEHWPNPISVVIPVVAELHFAHKGLNSLPFRIPHNERLRSFLKATGPLATTSANFSGKPPATTMQAALSYFRSGVDFYVDGGDLSHRKPSTIIKINTNGEPEIIRGDT